MASLRSAKLVCFPLGDDNIAGFDTARLAGYQGLPAGQAPVYRQAQLSCQRLVNIASGINSQPRPNNTAFFN